MIYTYIDITSFLSRSVFDTSLGEYVVFDNTVCDLERWPYAT